MLLGTQGWRRFVHLAEPLEKVAGEVASEETVAPNDDSSEANERAEAIEQLVAMDATQQFPTLYDNLEEVQPAYQSDVAQLHRPRETAISAAGQISFFGGAALMVVVIMLGIFRLVREVYVWLPATLAAIVCIIAGGMWMGTEVDQQGQLALTGFAGFDASRVVALVDGESDSEDSSSSSVFETTAEAPDDADPLAAPGEEAPLALEEFDEAAPVEALEAEAAEVAPQAAPAPVVAQPEFANGPFPADDLDADAFRIAADEIMLEREKADRLQGLGPIANDLKDLEFGWLQGGGRGFGGEDGEADYRLAGPSATGFGNIWFDGSVGDVARMRTLLQRAMKAGDEKETMKIGAAYQKLLAQYQLPIRQYAHQHSPGEPGVRTLYIETTW